MMKCGTSDGVKPVRMLVFRTIAKQQRIAMEQFRRQRGKIAAVCAAVVLSFSFPVVAQQDPLEPPSGVSAVPPPPPPPPAGTGRGRYSRIQPGTVVPAVPGRGVEHGEQRRNLIRLVSPSRNSASDIEVDVEQMPFRQVLLHIYRSGGFDRGVVVLGDDTDDLVSLYYVGTADGLDRVLDELLDAAGWVRVRSIDAPDLIYKSQREVPLYAGPAAYPDLPGDAPPGNQYGTP